MDEVEDKERQCARACQHLKPNFLKSECTKGFKYLFIIEVFPRVNNFSSDFAFFTKCQIDNLARN